MLTISVIIDGQTHRFGDFQPNTIIRKVKETIYKVTGDPVDRQTLLLRGAKLSNYRTLEELEIDANSKLELRVESSNLTLFIITIILVIISLFLYFTDKIF